MTPPAARRTKKATNNNGANSGKKRGRIENLKPWPKGVSGNPKGAPRRGESWAEVIKRISELTPSEAAQMSLELSKKLLSIGDGVTLKQAVVLRVYSALLFDPDARLFNAIMDRAEGKVTQAITVEDVTGKADSELVTELEGIIERARQAASASDLVGATAPSADASPPAGDA